MLIAETQLILLIKTCTNLGLLVFVGREQLQLGSLSHYINARATGYEQLPDFPEVPPPGDVRNVEPIETFEEAKQVKVSVIIKPIIVFPRNIISFQDKRKKNMLWESEASSAASSSNTSTSSDDSDSSSSSESDEEEEASKNSEVSSEDAKKPKKYVSNICVTIFYFVFLC